MIKLIVSDMDGTLLDDNKRIDERIYSLFPKFTEKGITFVVASGRQYPSLRRYFEDYLEDIVIVCENGAFIVENDEELFSKTMSNGEMKECLLAIEYLNNDKTLVTPLSCAKYRSYSDSKELCDYLSCDLFSYKMQFIDDLYNVNEDIIKISMICNEGVSPYDIQEKLKILLDNKFSSAVSGQSCLDIGLRGVNKGLAVEFLQEKLSIKKEETLVFGDQFNDIEMFQKADLSYVLIDAVEEVKSYAKGVIGSNNDGSVVDMIKKVVDL